MFLTVGLPTVLHQGRGHVQPLAAPGPVARVRAGPSLARNGPPGVRLRPKKKDRFATRLP
jgi:hypothetical protein